MNENNGNAVSREMPKDLCQTVQEPFTQRQTLSANINGGRVHPTERKKERNEIHEDTTFELDGSSVRCVVWLRQDGHTRKEWPSSGSGYNHLHFLKSLSDENDWFLWGQSWK